MAPGAVLCTSCGYSASPHPATAPRIKPPRVEREPNWLLWPLYLFIRPKIFFQHCVVDSIPIVTALCVWMFGVASSIDRVQFQHFRASATGRPMPVPDNWSYHWGFFLGGGLLGGAIMYAIGGWWYRLRVKWCGEKSPDPYRVRRVYIFASLVWAIPMILLTISDTMMHARPSIAFDNPSTFGFLVVFICLFWSTGTSYVGVRTAFNVKRPHAIGWFIVGPVIGYCIGFVFIALVAIAVMLSPGNANPLQPLPSGAIPGAISAPQVGSSAATNTFQGEIRFEYPGDWVIDLEMSDGNEQVVIESPRQEAMVEILAYETDAPLAEHLTASMQEAGAQMDSFAPGPSPAKDDIWDVAGAGFGRVDEMRIIHRVFIRRLGGDRYLTVRETYDQVNQLAVQDGLKLIRSSVRVQGEDAARSP
jgi:hypothetical protein